MREDKHKERLNLIAIAEADSLNKMDTSGKTLQTQSKEDLPTFLVMTFFPPADISEIGNSTELIFRSAV